MAPNDFDNSIHDFDTTDDGSGPEPSPELWRHTPFTAFVAGEDTRAVYVRDHLPVLMPSFVVDFALRCTEFRSLPGHIARYAESQAWGSAEIEALRSWQRKLVRAGLFISRTELYTRAAAIRESNATPAKIGVIGFSTAGDRADLLLRALGSFAENVQTHGRAVDFLVADSAVDAGHRGRLRGLAGERAADLGVTLRYLGEQEKRLFATELIRRSQCRPEAVEFALFDPFGAGSAGGANRNALMLHEAGSVLAAVADDVLCELASTDSGDFKLALFSDTDPYDRWVFADRADALEAVSFEPRDYLAEQEKLLGRNLGDLLAGVPVNEVNVRKLGLTFLHLLDSGAARIRTTHLGHAGNPAIPTSSFYAPHKGTERELAAEAEIRYRASFASRGALARLATPSVGDGTVSPGMAIGLDHRELLPPFFPVLPAEDLVFGATMGACCPGALSGHLPLCLRHETNGDNAPLHPGEINRARQGSVFEFSQILRAIMAGHQPATQADTTARMQKLGRYICEFAAQPTLDFREALHRIVLTHESQKIMALEHALFTEIDAPEFWRRDIRDFLDHSRDRMQHEDFDIPYELKAGRTNEENRILMQKLIASYGRLLEDWPAIVAAAWDLRSEGKQFSASAKAD
ncbi:hypothetical protein CfE428DRAFT_2006 [Chthoniobacter flavus Ellin428]|uniref:Uncharacterized protein n=1 Tax=Chthoniobacter flavus Ellin428 TaxID=497964 RepID=B4CZB8_9BACT|nr:hypothetical protein [Chthoniobacter flavus]EDY20809.1 hypothetical protein CfE428DRAFT_2006 [Chthoniobacter flavus Ellin428]TCO89700.1 hypothetical protein EV701_113136 [Chthoniobacter flavus]